MYMHFVHDMKWCTQKLFVASCVLLSFSMEGEEEALEPCKGGALVPMHKVELGAHAKGGSW